MAYLRGTNWSNGREYENMDHPLNRKSTYDREQHHFEWVMRTAINQAHIRYLDRIWGKGWSDI